MATGTERPPHVLFFFAEADDKTDNSVGVLKSFPTNEENMFDPDFATINIRMETAFSSVQLFNLQEVSIQTQE